MQISHEVPLCMLEASRFFNNYDYALVHMFEKYPEYYQFFKKSLVMGRNVILDNCLSYFSKITLADGSKKLLGTIVKNKLPVEVLTLNLETGQYETKKVLNWFEGTDQEINWFKVIVTSAKHNRKKGIVGTVCTEDHKFWVVNKGMVRCKNLKEEDHLLFNEIQFTDVQQQLILGSFLGDGSVAVNSCERGIFTCCHSDKQIKYLNLKRKILQNYLIKAYNCANNTRGFNTRKDAKLECLRTKNLIQIPKLFIEINQDANWIRIREKYGVKSFKKKYSCIIPKLSYLGLAFWYMDDGNYNNNDRSPISIFSLSPEALEEKQAIIQILKNVFDLDGKIYSYGKNNTDVRLGLSVASTKKMHSYIAQFLPVSMQYKLHPAFRNSNTFLNRQSKSFCNR